MFTLIMSIDLVQQYPNSVQKPAPDPTSWYKNILLIMPTDLVQQYPVSVQKAVPVQTPVPAPRNQRQSTVLLARLVLEKR